MKRAASSKHDKTAKKRLKELAYSNPEYAKTLNTKCMLEVQGILLEKLAAEKITPED